VWWLTTARAVDVDVHAYHSLNAALSNVSDCSGLV